jgi:hypothetical protein
MITILKCMYCLLILSRLLTVDRPKIIQVLQELRILNSLVQLKLQSRERRQASVKIDNLTSKPFSISSGVRQGYPRCCNSI